MTGTGRKTAVYVMVVAIIYVAVELVSVLALHGLKAVRPDHFVHGFVDRHFDALTDDHRKEYVEQAYDRTLGWDYKPLQEYSFRNSIDEPYKVSYDQDGARADTLPDKDLLIATYGDSFTWCAEVGNHQTWQYFLESRLGHEVQNFGVAAYGTGQAVLKFEEHLANRPVAPIAILGILEDNVNRVVNSFRPFLNPPTGYELGFKPSFETGSVGKVTMIPNPYDDGDATLSELRSLAHGIAERDFWVARSGRIEIRFPYTVQLVRATSFLATRKYRAWTGASAEPSGGLNLWETAEGNAVMHFLVDRFVELAVEANSIPVVLFIPANRTMRDSTVANYARFKSEISERHGDLTVIDLTEHEFDRERFHLQPYEGHASEYGNGVIADVIEQTVRSFAEGELGRQESNLRSPG